MSSYYQYAQFTSCTPLASFIDGSYSLTLDWLLPTTSDYKYQKIDLYRYIGELGQSIYPTIDNTHSVLIYTATQNFTTSDVYNNTITTQLKNPNQTPATIAINLTDLMNFTDDLNTYNQTTSLLANQHHLTDVVNDSQLLREINQGQRVVWYIAQTWIRGAFDSSPYCIASHASEGILDNTSTKTQVRHNLLHFEGDIIWATWLLGADHSGGKGISRTSVDLKSLYTYPINQGVTGSGGYTWVSDRSGGYMFRCNLGNGLQTGKFLNASQEAIASGSEHGYGICVDINTGDCLGGSYTSPSLTMRCKTSSLNSLANETTTPAAVSIPVSVSNNYGMVNIPQKNSAMVIKASQESGTTVVFNITNGATLYSYNFLASDSTKTYGMASGPDGTIYTSTYHDGRGVGVLKTTTAYSAGVISPAPTHYHYGCTTDNSSLWPNTSNIKTKYHVLFGGREDGVNLPEDLAVNTTLSIPSIATNRSVLNVNSANWRGIGIDGQNNIWGLGVTRSKIYRLQSGTTYPFQSLCRYPPNTLPEQPFSYTNTPEVEWFLLRDAGYNSKVGTVDDTEVVTWNGTPYTAHDAWWSLVENARFELNPSSYAGTGSKKPTGGFSVTKPDGTVSAYTKNYGIRMKNWSTNSAGVLTAINSWYETFCNPDTTLYTDALSTTRMNGNLSGRRLFPWYGTPDASVLSAYNASLPTYAANTYKPGFALGDLTTPSYTITFPNWNGYSYVYSDFTGNLLAGSIVESAVNYDIVGPSFTPPPPPVPPPVPPPSDEPFDIFICEVSGIQNNGGYQETRPECYPWTTTVSSPETLATYLTGYDDLTVVYNITAFSHHFNLTSMNITPDDYSGQTYTILVDHELANASKVFRGSYVYNDPSRIGLQYLPSGNPAVYEYLTNRKSTGNFNATIGCTGRDVYDGLTYMLSSRVYDATVLERWPEPRVYLELSDLSRTSMFCATSWGIDRYDKSVLVYNEANSTDALRYNVSYGVDPLHIEFQDRSIARTFPLSSWYLTLSTNNQTCVWYPTCLISDVSNPSLSVLADTQNNFDSITALDFRYGDYVATMNVAASTTSTSSDKVFVNYIHVSEFEPFANFWAISGSTVPATYTSDNPTTVADITGTFPNGNNPTYPFVSGYAPLLTVYFQDSSEAHTFPIGQYSWNFGDYYNEGSSDVTETSSNYYTICSNQIFVSGAFADGCWDTNYTAHTAAHTYTMSGTYDVTLTVTASVTNTMDTCAKHVETINDVKKFYVYVEELPPVFTSPISASIDVDSGFSDSPILTGLSPQTYYFIASGIVAGSFPICKMVWDFGDGTLETILRSPSATMTSQGLSISYNADPRYTIVPHTYTNDLATAQTYNINVSAYACNTNTMISTSANFTVGPVYNQYVQQAEQRRLIGSRFDTNGNLVYIFEGLTTHNTYTMVMSGEN